ncbi:MAG: hypothetical protein GX359_08005 [Clostridiales bacterium]|nr:hypothetical protein [Clostridiales bacterium]
MIRDCCTPKGKGSSVTVNVDVTKIVKYVCITGVFIVGIIFGTRCYYKLLDKNLSEVD